MNKLILLGTGNAAHLTRHLTSLCFVINNRTFLIDCGDGMGSLRNLVKAGVHVEDVNDVFITHRHADHVAGMTHYLFLKMLEKETRVRVYGPKEAVDVVKTVSLLTHDLTERNQDRIDFHAMQSGDSIKLGDTTVTSTLVKHGLPVSYAFAVNAGKTKIVFTGDMQPNTNFDSLAKGATIIIHECFGLTNNEELWHKLGHSSAKDAGETAMRAGVKQLILTHLPTKDFDVDPELLKKEAKKYFLGDVEVAEDCMEIPFE